MAQSVDPVATAKLRITLQFDFTDKGLHFSLRIHHGTCEITKQPSEDPDLRVTCSTEVWAQVFMREINIKDALIDGRIKLEGNKYLFTRLDRYFPPPSN